LMDCLSRWKGPYMTLSASSVDRDLDRLFDQREYVGVDEISGPIVVVRGIHNVGYNELVEVIDGHGSTRLGMTL